LENVIDLNVFWSFFMKRKIRKGDVDAEVDVKERKMREPSLLVVE